MNEKSNAALTVGFFAVIILIFTIADWLTGDRIFSENENRMLATRPKLGVETILDGSFMEDYEAYVTDQFVGRDTWVELKTRGDVLLQKKAINGVYLGADDYLIEQHLSADIKQEDVKFYPKYSKDPQLTGDRGKTDYIAIENTPALAKQARKIAWKACKK